MNEYVRQVLRERKGFIDFLLIIFPSSVIANVVASIVIEWHWSYLIFFVLFFSFIALLFGFYRSLKCKVFEYVIAEELVLDQTSKTISLKLDFGHSTVLALINEIYSEEILKNSSLVNNQTEELASYWSFSLDVFEYLIFDVIDKVSTGWGMIQTSKYFYSGKGSLDGKKYSSDSLPDELKNKNLLLKKFIKELSKENSRLAEKPFFVPLSSNIHYSRTGSTRDSRSIIVENDYAVFKIGLEMGTSGYKSLKQNSKILYYAPQISFEFESKPFLALSKNYEKSLAWSEFFLKSLKVKLTNFAKGDLNA